MKNVMFALLLLVLCCGISSAEVKRFQIPLENSPVIGPANAPITIVEFIDYQ